MSLGVPLPPPGAHQGTTTPSSRRQNAPKLSARGRHRTNSGVLLFLLLASGGGNFHLTAQASYPTPPGGLHRQLSDRHDHSRTWGPSSSAPSTQCAPHHHAVPPTAATATATLAAAAPAAAANADAAAAPAAAAATLAITADPRRANQRTGGAPGALQRPLEPVGLACERAGSVRPLGDFYLPPL